jgi:hypothetical protein
MSELKSMSELKKTSIFVGAAVVLALLALVTAPRNTVPDAFADRGEPFFPDFEDPNLATTLEVIEFDEETAAARPFKVTFEEGRWTIPSHHGYPADAKDRLAKTAAGVIGIRKDDFRSDNVSDHEGAGVIDPLDETTATLRGRGKRVTLRGAGGEVLADFIVGKQPEGRTGHRFVRIPDQKRVYVAKIDVDLSSEFADWIEQDVLLTERDDLDRVVIKDYSIDERTRRVQQRDVVTLRKQDGKWEIDKEAPGKELDTSKVNSLISALDGLSVVGVRPKPAGLSASLTSAEDAQPITQADLLSLQAKGYYLTRAGALMSNEGELQVSSDDGIEWTLRFGEILYGSGAAVSAGTEEGEAAEAGPGENRYLFVTASFNPELLTEPEAPVDLAFLDKEESEWSEADRASKALYDAHEAWKQRVAEAENKAEELNARFADWYYVISADSFDKVHLGRADLLKEKKEDS